MIFTTSTPYFFFCFLERQLRTRDCRDCTFYLFSLTEPVIELSKDIRFAPFNGAYSEVCAFECSEL